MINRYLFPPMFDDRELFDSIGAGTIGLHLSKIGPLRMVGELVPTCERLLGIGMHSQNSRNLFREITCMQDALVDLATLNRILFRKSRRSNESDRTVCPAIPLGPGKSRHLPGILIGLTRPSHREDTGRLNTCLVRRLNRLAPMVAPAASRPTIGPTIITAVLSFGAVPVSPSRIRSPARSIARRSPVLTSRPSMAASTAARDGVSTRIPSTLPGATGPGCLAMPDQAGLGLRVHGWAGVGSVTVDSGWSPAVSEGSCPALPWHDPPTRTRGNSSRTFNQASSSPMPRLAHSGKRSTSSWTTSVWA